MQAPHIAHKSDGGLTLTKIYSKPHEEKEAAQMRPMSRRDELKYMNQRSNLVLGYFDFTNGEEHKAAPTVSAAELYIGRVGSDAQKGN